MGPKNIAVARPIHVSNSHTKSGWISSNGLGGDCITDGQTDGGDYNSLFLKKTPGDYNTRAIVVLNLSNDKPRILCLYRNMITHVRSSIYLSKLSIPIGS